MKTIVVLVAPIKFHGQIGQKVEGKEAWTMGYVQFDYLKQNMIPQERIELDNYVFEPNSVRIEVFNGTLCAVAVGLRKA